MPNEYVSGDSLRAHFLFRVNSFRKGRRRRVRVIFFFIRRTQRGIDVAIKIIITHDVGACALFNFICKIFVALRRSSMLEFYHLHCAERG